MRSLTLFPAVLLFTLFHGHCAAQLSLEWARRIGSGSEQSAVSVAHGDAGELYTLGIFTGTVDLDPGPGTANVTSPSGYSSFLVKFDPDGDFVWGSAFRANPARIAVSSAGVICAVGRFSGTFDADPGPGVFNLTAAGPTDGFAIFLSADGAFISAFRWGGAGQEAEVNAAAFDGENNVYLTGSFSGTIDADPGSGIANISSMGSVDAFMVSLDADRSFRWAGRIGGGGVDYGQGLEVDGSGDLVVIGMFSGSVDMDPGPGSEILVASGSSNVFIVKLTHEGTFIWARHLPASVGPYVWVDPVSIDTGDNIFITGRFTGTVDLDPGAGTEMFSSAGGQDIYLIKLNSEGQYEWARTIGGTGADIALAVAAASTERIVVTGAFTGTVDFDPGPGQMIFTTTSSNASFVWMLDGAGQFVWAGRYGDNNNSNATALSIGPMGEIVNAGGFYGTFDADPGPGVSNLVSAGADDAFIIKFAALTTMMAEVNSPDRIFTLHPNPTDGHVFLTAAQEIGEVMIHDATGAVVLRERISASSVAMDIGALAPGVYLFRLGEKTQRMMKY